MKKITKILAGSLVLIFILSGMFIELYEATGYNLVKSILLEISTILAAIILTSLIYYAISD